MKRYSTSLVLLTAIFVSCSNQADIKHEEKKIRNLLHQERKAHFDRNVELFMKEFADSMISVNRGVVKTSTPGENKKRISSYFSSVEFIKWDDLAEPIIRFSKDGSLAYTLIQKEVIVTYADSTGKAFYDSTYYAWAPIYRKYKGDWKVEANISTNK